MTREIHSTASLFTQLDVGSAQPGGVAALCTADEQTRLLRDILNSQERQNELLEELVSQMGAAQKQRNTELGQWKQANPRLARSCRLAADALNKVQTQFLESMTAEVNENAEELLDGEFLLNEFVDRFGPRLAHLNGVIQVLAQLSAVPNATNNA